MKAIRSQENNLSRCFSILGALTIFLVALLMISACGSTPAPDEATPTAEITPESSPTPTPDPTPEMTPTPERPAYLEVDPDDLAGITVRFAHPWVGEPADTIGEIAVEFSDTNPWGISVSVEPYGGQTALMQALESDLDDTNTPGLFVAHPYHLALLENTFYTINLNSYFYDEVWGFDLDDRDDIRSEILTQFRVEDRLVALPIAPQATVMFYNQSWSQTLGFSAPPADADQFEEQSCAAQSANWQDGNRANDGTGGWLINLNPNVLVAWYQAYGGELPQNEPIRFNNEQAREAFGYLWSIRSAGCIWFGRQPDPMSYLANRNAIFYAGALDLIPAQISWMDVADNADEWTVFGFPGPEGETIIVDGPGLMIGADSPEQQLAAWLFARYLLEAEAQASLVRSLFSVPVRESAMQHLEDFSAEYPQWAQGASLISSARTVPVSDHWGLSQWVLQDAIFRLLQSEENRTDEILEQLDEMIEMVEGR